MNAYAVYTPLSQRDSITTYSCARALHLLTFTVGSVRIKPSISPKRLKIVLKLLQTAAGWYKIVHGLSIAANMNDLE